MYGYQARVGPCIQLFQERWSEKVHATIPKGIVGDFEFTVFQKNFKEWHENHGTMFAMLKESDKVDSTATVSGKVHDHIPYYLSGLSRAQFFRQPFSK